VNNPQMEVIISKRYHSLAEKALSFKDIEANGGFKTK
jgi:hypothetical protein